jgi:hypothetical protein
MAPGKCFCNRASSRADLPPYRRDSSATYIHIGQCTARVTATMEGIRERVIRARHTRSWHRARRYDRTPRSAIAVLLAQRRYQIIAGAIPTDGRISTVETKDVPQREIRIGGRFAPSFARVHSRAAADRGPVGLRLPSRRISRRPQL